MDDSGDFHPFTSTIQQIVLSRIVESTYAIQRAGAVVNTYATSPLRGTFFLVRFCAERRSLVVGVRYTCPTPTAVDHRIAPQCGTPHVVTSRGYFYDNHMTYEQLATDETTGVRSATFAIPAVADCVTLLSDDDFAGRDFRFMIASDADPPPADGDDELPFLALAAIIGGSGVVGLVVVGTVVRRFFPQLGELMLDVARTAVGVLRGVAPIPAAPAPASTPASAPASTPASAPSRQGMQVATTKGKVTRMRQ
jgi:hypothetical protein